MSSLPSLRQFLATAASGVVPAAVAPSSFGAEPRGAPPTMPRNPFVYRFALGDIKAWSISDGHMLFRDGLNLMWPEADRSGMNSEPIAQREQTDALPLYVPARNRCCT